VEEEEEQPLPPPEEVEAVPSPSFSNWSSSDNDSKRNLEDDEDAVTQTPKDSLCLLRWEEVERKAEEEEDEMSRAGGAVKVIRHYPQVRKDSGGRRAGRPRRVRSAWTWRVLACLQFTVGRFAEVARIWKDATERRKEFEGSANGEGAATAVAVVVISSNKEE
jgi:hypothetical protein